MWGKKPLNHQKSRIFFRGGYKSRLKDNILLVILNPLKKRKISTWLICSHHPSYFSHPLQPSTHIPLCPFFWAKFRSVAFHETLLGCPRSQLTLPPSSVPWYLAWGQFVSQLVMPGLQTSWSTYCLTLLLLCIFIVLFKCCLTPATPSRLG